MASEGSGRGEGTEVVTLPDPGDAPEELTHVAAPRLHSLPLLRGKNFFELSADMLCLAGLDGYFKVLNHGWSETLGYRDDELLRAPYVDFVHPDDRAATIAEAAKLGKGFKTVEP